MDILVIDVGICMHGALPLVGEALKNWALTKVGDEHRYHECVVVEGIICCNIDASRENGSL